MCLSHVMPRGSYREFLQCKKLFYLRTVKVLSPETSEILRYSEFTKTTSFSILGFEFPEVLPNQKYQPWSLNFYFYEEINPILGSLKNSSLVKSLNFP